MGLRTAGSSVGLGVDGVASNEVGGLLPGGRHTVTDGELLGLDPGAAHRELARRAARLHDAA